LNTYIDSSVLLRVILGAADALEEWPRITQMFSSDLLQIECMRTLERLRVVDRVDPQLIAFQRDVVMAVVSRARLSELSPLLVRRAGHPLPVPLKTLDAIHLVTANWWRERVTDLAFATHDLQLARAAREAGFQVLGG
jgi:predicted nucleic acid-binding protein